jgi:hypothetical protein
MVKSSAPDVLPTPGEFLKNLQAMTDDGKESVLDMIRWTPDMFDLLLLGVSCAAGDLEQVKALVEKTPSHLKSSCSSRNFKKLFSAGCPRQIPDQLTPLILACLFGQIEVVRWLVDQPGAWIDHSPEEYGDYDNPWTPWTGVVARVMTGWRGSDKNLPQAMTMAKILLDRGRGIPLFKKATSGGPSPLSMLIHELSLPGNDDSGDDDDPVQGLTGEDTQNNAKGALTLLNFVLKGPSGGWSEKDWENREEHFTSINKTLPDVKLAEIPEQFKGEGAANVTELVLGWMVKASFPPSFLNGWQVRHPGVWARLEKERLNEVLTQGEIPASGPSQPRLGRL